MKFLSVCSGIEAASVAWHPLGWQAAAYSEIEKFSSQVLTHHYPNTPNVGDMTKFKEWTNVSDVDVLVGGTPCQSFSVAGLRKGLDDPRGNLMLTYLAIADKYRPRWLVWENVPGVLSSAGGRDFGSFLGGLAECGYGFAYRVLDAQYFGVAQRRKRVFVVGYLGDWRPAAAVLFERHSLQGHPAPSRKAREGAAASIASGAFISDYDVAGTLDKGVPRRGIGHNGNYDSQVVSMPMVSAMHSEISPAPKARDHKGPSSDGDGAILVPMQPIAYNIASGKGALKDDIHVTDAYTTKTLDASGSNPAMHQGGAAILQPMAVAFSAGNSANARSIGYTEEGTPPLRSGASGTNQVPTMAQGMAVRRLTCVECERLQGFPDRYTDIQPKGKATPDGPRYKALGNSMAVPVMAWIGKRIQEVDALVKTRETT